MRLKAEHIAYQQQQATVQKKLQEEILLREESAKKNVTKYIKEKQKNVRKREVWYDIHDILKCIAKYFLCNHFKRISY